MKINFLKMSLQKKDLTNHLKNLLKTFFPHQKNSTDLLRNSLDKSLEKTYFCFSHINKKYYRDGKYILFNHYNSDHMAFFLYTLANTIWKDTRNTTIPTCLSYLNKILHGLDLYFEVRMPKIFQLVHPVGSVLGRASYKNFLVVYQNCTVGADGSSYPILGEKIILYSKTSILGRCQVGDNVVFGANALLLNKQVPSNSLVVGQSPDNKILPNKKCVLERAFN